MKPTVAALLIATVLTPVDAALAEGAAKPETTTPPAWCAPGTQSLENATCYYEPQWHEARPTATDLSDTVVIFLHSLVAVDSNWQWEQQGLMMRTAA